MIKPGEILQKWVNRKMQFSNKWKCNKQQQKITPNEKWESDCNGKDENVTEEVTLVKPFTLKEYLEKFQNIKNAKGQMLKAYSYLERSMDNWPNYRKDVCFIP